MLKAIETCAPLPSGLCRGVDHRFDDPPFCCFVVILVATRLATISLFKIGLTYLAIAPGSPALAGGGAHIVDDDATLSAGVCYIENWLTLDSNADALAVAATACIISMLPRLEIAAAIQRTWRGRSCSDDRTSVRAELTIIRRGAGRHGGPDYRDLEACS